MRILCLALAAVMTPVVVFGQSDIRSVDFKNFTYDADYCGGEGVLKITVKDGKFYKETKEQDFVDRMYFAIYRTAYGDMTGDGKEEAVVFSMCNTGGTGNFTEAYIYQMKNGNPERIMLLSGGDRAFGGLRDASISDGILTIESNDAGKSGGACCPEFVVTNRYRYTGTTLKEVGKSTTRALYPPERIAFKRGRSNTSFILKMGADDQIKRFVVGARKGQKMTVSTSAKEAKVYFKTGAATVAKDGETLHTIFNETGDFVFEINNFTQKAMTTEVTVTIN